MTSSAPEQHSKSRFASPVFWAVLSAVSLGCALFAFANFERAFSLVDLELRMDRVTALSEARRLAESFDWGPDAFRQAASFRVDDRSRSFVELEGGGREAFAALINEGPYYPYLWVVRHFRENDARELEVRFLPDGTPYGYRERLPEDAPGAALDADAARAIAEDGAGAPWNVDLAAYELVESSRTEQPSGRVDHTFVYELGDRQAGVGRFRLSLVVSGDRPTALAHFIQIPEGFDRRYEEMRSANNGIASGATLAMALLYGGGAVVGLFVLLRQRRVLWRMALVFGVGIAVLQALAGFNSWPLIWMNYNTSVSESSFAIQQIVALIGSTALLAVLFTLSFMAAESLSRRAFPQHAQLWQCWSRDGARSWPIVGQTAGGYLAVGAMLAFVVAFYWFSSTQLGWWSPSDTLYQPDSVATVLPWFNPLAISLQAGFWEECLFRAVPLAGAALLGERFGHRRAWIAAAFVVQILVFGAGHANYPAQPAYARVVELILPSIVFGLLYLRFGLLPAIVMHFAYDAVLFSMPLFLSTAAGAWIDQGLFLLLFLVPVWVVLAARVRGGAWIEAPARLYNAAWQPMDRTPTRAAAQAAPVTAAALPRVPVSVAIAVAGLAFWAYVSVKPVESPPIGISRGAAVEVAREALSASGANPADWRESAIFAGGVGPQHRFVWNEAGPEAFRAVLRPYLSTLSWRVRYARFEGDVAERAEEYVVWINGNGTVERFQHRLAESTAGASLEEAAAREIAREALAGLDPGSAPGEVSARSERLPARTDWYFTFRDESPDDLAGGEARVEVQVAGDEVVDTRRFLFVPEQWQRDDNQRRNSVAIAATASNIVLLALLFAGAVAGVIGFARGRASLRAALAVGGLMLVLQGIGLANNLPTIWNSLSTAQPLPLQLGVLLASSAVGVLISAAVLGLVAGHVQGSVSGPPQQGRTPLVLGGLALGFGSLGALALAGSFSASPVPPWSNFSFASTALPWLATAFAPVQRFVVLTLAALLIVRSANAFTANGTRRRIPAAAGLFLIGLLLAPGPAPDDVMSWWLKGAVAGAVLLASYFTILRAYPLLVVPAAAALSLPPVAATGLQGAYTGVLLGALLATAGILAVAWRWFDVAHDVE